MVDCLGKLYREISRQQTLSLLHVLSGFDYDGDNMVITDKSIVAGFIGDEDLEDYKLVYIAVAARFRHRDGADFLSSAKPIAAPITILIESWQPVEGQVELIDSDHVVTVAAEAIEDEEQR
ncbi:hypothetical protein ACLOJK_041848 [Asimina triloba]